MCQHVAHRPASREATLLQIEFKAYAVRHPRRRKRLADLHAAMLGTFALKEIVEFVPQMREGSCSLAVAGAVEGLTLNHMFAPEVITVEHLAHLTEIILTDEIRRAQES